VTVTVTANQSSRLYNDMGLAVCESNLTQFVDPLKIVSLPTSNDISWSGFGGMQYTNSYDLRQKKS